MQRSGLVNGFQQLKQVLFLTVRGLSTWTIGHPATQHNQHEFETPSATLMERASSSHGTGTLYYVSKVLLVDVDLFRWVSFVLVHVCIHLCVHIDMSVAQIQFHTSHLLESSWNLSGHHIDIPWES